MSACQNRLEATPTSYEGTLTISPTVTETEPVVTTINLDDTVASPIATSDIAKPTNETTTIDPTIQLTLPVQERVNFSVSSSNQTLPEDILQEVSFFLGGNGGEAICRQSNGVFPIEDPDHEGLVELGQKIHFAICGWQRENSTVIVTLPDGQTELIEATYYGDNASGISQIMFAFYPDINSPAGTYTFTFSGFEIYPQVTVEVAEPSGPRLIWDKPEDKIIIFGFNPNEPVRLLAYRSTENNMFVGTLVGWQAYETDSNGQLIIQVEADSSVDGFAVVGDTSGMAESFVIVDESKFVFLHLIRTAHLDIFQ